MKNLIVIIFAALIISGCSNNEEFRNDVKNYLDSYNKKYQELYKNYSESQWELNTHIVDGDTISKQKAQEAEEAFTQFIGSTENIEKAKQYLDQKEDLTDLQVKQLEKILYLAGSNPMTAEEIVKEKIKVSNDQVEKLYGFEFKVDGESITPNEIDRILAESDNLNERLKVWTASKEVGKVLKPGVAKLQDLRNKSVKGLGYNDFYDYQVSDYGMSVEELRQVMQNVIQEIWPLYREIHTWARYSLAEKYGEKVPDFLPAHWLPNRWGQEWVDLVEVKGLNLDEALQKKSAEWIVEKGEEFYVSLGLPELPESFYEKSSLYPLPKDVNYKKNTHASAWHMDNDKDIRSLMSVEPNTRWWGTTLHELGHIYYFISYSNPDVPIILRDGANRAYHEAIGSMIELAAKQKPFLEHFNLLPKNSETDSIQSLMKEALDQIVFIPWSAGVMTEFEYELYSNNLTADQYNQKWWDLKKQYQGIVPPSFRSEEYCDAASKTHITDDAGQYYDYAMSVILLFQFHDYIATEILNQDPHATNYYGNKDVGKFLHELLKPGATVDWRDHLKNSIGSEMSAKAMVNYFQPLMDYLKEINKGRNYTLPEKI